MPRMRERLSDLPCHTLLQTEGRSRLEEVRLRTSRAQSLRHSTRSLQDRLQRTQQKIDAGRHSTRQRAARLFAQMQLLAEEERQAQAVGDTKRSELLAQLAITLAGVHEEQRRSVADVIHIFPIHGAGQGAITLGKAAVPTSLEHYQRQEPMGRKQMACALGHMTLVVDVLARVMEVPLLHHAVYCGARTAVSQPGSYWEVPAVERSSEGNGQQRQPLYLTAHDDNVNGSAGFVRGLTLLQRSVGALTHAHYGADALSSLPTECSPYIWLALLCGKTSVPSSQALSASVMFHRLGVAAPGGNIAVPAPTVAELCILVPGTVAVHFMLACNEAV
jgi:hypothetical protein